MLRFASSSCITHLLSNCFMHAEISKQLIEMLHNLKLECSLISSGSIGRRNKFFAPLNQYEAEQFKLTQRLADLDVIRVELFASTIKFVISEASDMLKTSKEGCGGIERAQNQ